ncbi:MAG: T9SS type A sorting domain-containing protein [Bacteroidetes bacterium]|nr:T9SS type A sorting domain-containing protein [Bacteroidota bacterium]
MKKNLLVIIFIAFSFFAKAQPLQNTTWALYNSANTFLSYFVFGSDTIYFGTSLSSLSPLSIYWGTGNNFNIADLGGSCSPTDTGRYTYSIQNDTMRFTLISDPCANRASTLTTSYMVGIITGIRDQQAFSSVELFPNPSVNGIFNIRSGNEQDRFSRVTVRTVEGRIIEDEKLNSTLSSKTISLENFPPGIYFLALENVTGSKVFRVIR